jgi:hypothetical protein
MQNDPDTLPTYFLLLFPLYFAAIWTLVSWIVSFIGGWYALSKHLRAQHDPQNPTATAGPFGYGVKMRFRTHYGNVIRITSAPDGLYLSVLVIFRIAHPPLFIPWSDIEFTRTTFLWWRYVILILGRNERIPMRISERMARNAGVLEHISDSMSLR